MLMLEDIIFFERDSLRTITACNNRDFSWNKGFSVHYCNYWGVHYTWSPQFNFGMKNTGRIPLKIMGFNNHNLSHRTLKHPALWNIWYLFLVHGNVHPASLFHHLQLQLKWSFLNAYKNNNQIHAPTPTVNVMTHWYGDTEQVLFHLQVLCAYQKLFFWFGWFYMP